MSLTFILKRLALAIPTLFGVAVIVFVLLRVVPGDPIAMMIGPGATEADIRNLRVIYGLDRSLFDQFLIYIGGLARGGRRCVPLTNRPIAFGFRNAIKAVGGSLQAFAIEDLHMAARAADLQDAVERRDQWLERAQDHAPDERAAVLVTLAEMQMRRGHDGFIPVNEDPCGGFRPQDREPFGCCHRIAVRCIPGCV